MLKPRLGEGRKSPMSSEVSGKEPRYSYAKPTEKAQHGKTPALGYDIAEYDLPVMDVQTERRNFPGYDVQQFFSLDEIRQGDQSGSTETDSATSGKMDAEYTNINRKSGSHGRPTKRS